MIIHNDFYFSIHILLGCSLLITIKNDMFDQSEGKLWNYCLVILTDGNQRVECTMHTFVATVQCCCCCVHIQYDFCHQWPDLKPTEVIWCHHDSEIIITMTEIVESWETRNLSGHVQQLVFCIMSNKIYLDLQLIHVTFTICKKTGWAEYSSTVLKMKIELN